jgi:hypothetical protein
MRDYVIRVRSVDGAYAATMRETQCAPRYPDAHVSVGPPAVGHGANPSAAIVAAVAAAHLAEFVEPTRRPYAV